MRRASAGRRHRWLSVFPVLLGILAVLCPRAGAQGWAPQTSPVPADLFGIELLDADTGWIVGAGGTILHTSTGGSVWTPQVGNTTHGLRGVSFLDASFGLAVGDGGTILRTVNGGADWQVIRTDWMDVLRAVHVVDGSRAWAVGTNAIFQPFTARTTDGGLNWTFGAFYIQNNEGGLTDVWFTDAQNGFASAYLWDGRGAVCRTNDGGVSWTTVTVVGFALYGIHFPRAQIGVAVGLDGNVLRSTNGGLTWNPQWVGLGRDLRAVWFADPEAGWVVGESGWIARTTDGGAHWAQQGSGVSVVLRGIDGASPRIASVVGDGRTILRTTTGGEDPASVPSGLARPLVLAAYPNPFSNLTVIRRLDQVASTAPTETPCLIVCDAAGRRVRRLAPSVRFPAALDPGQMWVWDGLDEIGRRVTAGAYFVIADRGSDAPLRVVKIN